MSANRSSQSLNTTLSDTQITDLARPFVSMMEDFYRDPENEKGFQLWLHQRQQDEKDKECATA